MFYYIEVHLLAHYVQWIKMHGETVKNSDTNFTDLFYVSMLTPESVLFEIGFWNEA
jgi:hypothetical protein